MAGHQQHWVLFQHFSNLKNQKKILMADVVIYYDDFALIIMFSFNIWNEIKCI